MMDDAERGGYVSFPRNYYNLCKNLPIFYVKIMIFIKGTIFIFITVNSSHKKSFIIFGNLIKFQISPTLEVVLEVLVLVQKEIISPPLLSFHSLPLNHDIICQKKIRYRKVRNII